MKRRSLRILWILFWANTAWAGTWLREEDYARFHVVVLEAPDPAEAFAAKEFQKYWARSTGHPVTLSSQAALGKVNVYLGAAVSAYDADLSGLDEDGFLIKTIRERQPANADAGTPALLISGGSARGTLFGVYQFLEEYLGIRWLTPDATHIPNAPERLPTIQKRFNPKIAYRDVSYWAFANNPHFAAVHRLNGFWSGLPPEMGGHTSYVRGWKGFGHTFHYFLNPEEYFDEHPEYFSEVEGERLKYSQLCLTNPDVLRITVEKVRALLREREAHERIVSITQMDWPFWCTCANCAALDAHEESHSGALIHFVNGVAASIRDEFPDAYIDTFAYTYTREPPKHVKPLDNVIVRVCSMECDFSKPISARGAPSNKAFATDLKGWKALTKNLWVWDYTQNWHAHQAPHPNIHVLQANAKFFAKVGVQGVYEQASAFSPGSDFEQLKAYILAKSLWDPDTNWRRHYDEFIRLYYGQGAPFIREYLDLVRARVKEKGVFLSMYNYTREWMDYDTVVKAQSVFERAFDTVRDTTARHRLEEAYLSVEYSALICVPKYTVEKDYVSVRRPPSRRKEEYWDLMMDRGITHLSDEPIEVFFERLLNQDFPRFEEMPIEILENEHYEVWMLPSFFASVFRFRDKASGQELLNGFTLEDIALHHSKWQLNEALDPDNPGAEGYLLGRYHVEERSEDMLKVVGEMKNGLRVEEVFRLPAGSRKLEVSVRLINATDEDLAPWVKIHPEFWVPGKKEPELWFDYEGTWEAVPLFYEDVDQGFARAGFWPEGIRRWALRFPKGRNTLINTVTAGKVRSMDYIYSVPVQHFDLDLVFPSEPLAPGEDVAITATYEVVRKHPSKL